MTTHFDDWRDNYSTPDIATRLGIRMEREGRDFKAACPIHDERNGQSLHLYSDPGRGAYCFGKCGRGWDSAGLVMAVNHCDFPAALRFLGERTTTPTRPPVERKPVRGWHEGLAKAMQAGHKRLLADPALMARIAAERGLDEETIRHFEIGVAQPRSWSRGQLEAGEQHPAWLIPVRGPEGGPVHLKGRLWDVAGTGKYMPWEAGHGTPLNWCVRHARTLVLVVAGDFDAVALWQLGYNAVSVAGQGNLRAEYVPQFAGYDEAVMLFDPGEEDAAHKAAARLAKQVPLVRIGDFATTGYKDASALLAAGGTVGDVERVVKAARAINLKKASGGDGERGAPEPSGGEKWTDYGNAERLVAAHGDDLKYVPAWGWLYYDGKRWKVDEGNAEVMRRAKATVRGMYAEAADIEDSEQRGKFLAYVLRSESVGKLKAMIELAQSELIIAARPGDFDRDPLSLNVDNGTIDLRVDKGLRPHDRRDLITKLAPVAFNPTAYSERFYNFVRWMYQEQPEMIDYVQRLLGYCATGLTTEQVLPIWWGDGGNGKTTLLKLVARCLGDYAVTADVSMLVDRKPGSQTNDIAELVGARLILAHESDDGAKLAEGLVKQITGGDTIKARHLYKSNFEFEATFTIVLVTNHKPRIRGTDEGIWRRLRLIAHKAQISEEEKDRDLPDKLWADREAVLSWLVIGCQMWQARGLTMPSSVRAATTDYRNEQDLLAEFLEDRCLVDYRKTVDKAALYKAYADWAQERGERPVGQRIVSGKLQERGFEEVRRTGGGRMWSGLGLVEELVT